MDLDYFITNHANSTAYNPQFLKSYLKLVKETPYTNGEFLHEPRFAVTHHDGQDVGWEYEESENYWTPAFGIVACCTKVPFSNEWLRKNVGSALDQLSKHHTGPIATRTFDGIGNLDTPTTKLAAANNHLMWVNSPIAYRAASLQEALSRLKSSLRYKSKTNLARSSLDSVESYEWDGNTTILLDRIAARWQDDHHSQTHAVSQQLWCVADPASVFVQLNDKVVGYFAKVDSYCPLIFQGLAIKEGTLGAGASLLLHSCVAINQLGYDYFDPTTRVTIDEDDDCDMYKKVASTTPYYRPLLFACKEQVTVQAPYYSNGEWIYV